MAKPDVISARRARGRALPRRHFLGRILTFLAGAAAFGRVKPAAAAAQGIDPIIGDIMLVPFNFPPKGWALCNGQLLPINQNQALFSLLGTTYGGNGQTTFALPDLRGRVPIHFGQGPGLSSRTLGEKSGEDAHTLILSELPVHGHDGRCSTADGTSADPSGMYWARSAAQTPQYSNAASLQVIAATSSVGGSQPHMNHQPVLVLNYVIALQGVYPST